ncbi:MAG TPA: translesion error-prone DNA polymerase V autoproteolytic subunit [Pyrinomonadaceae bacterium]|nr:translesion error-prone DNA polymerase V autoproteolytic subunit [Pyrinomonadaceae bacterium]
MSKEIEFFPFSFPKALAERELMHLPLMAWRTSAGFPSPAEDYIESRIDLNNELIRHPNSTFLARNRGDSMEGAGIYPNSLLVIDRAEDVRPGNVVLARIENDFTVKRFALNGGQILLLPENDNYQPIEINTEDFEIWGRVIYSINKL